MPPAAARPAPPAAMPARPAAPAPSARRDVFGFGTPETAPAPAPAAAPADDDWSDLTSSATSPLAAPEPIELGGAEAEPELAPMHEFVPPAATTGHAPAAAPARTSPTAAPPVTATAAGGSGEAALRAALAGVSREVIERVVWEVVPQLAETIIRENLDRLVKNRQG